MDEQPVPEKNEIKPKKVPLMERLFGNKEVRRESRNKSKTIVKIKTVGDIPPITKTRKAFSEGQNREAIVTAYKYARDDYLRFYEESLNPGETDRQYILRSLGKMGVNIPESGLIDNFEITDKMNRAVMPNSEGSDKFNALKKLSSFYLEYYERTMYGPEWSPEPEVVIERLEDIYNYLDIMKLYYSQVEITSGQGDVY